MENEVVDFTGGAVRVTEQVRGRSSSGGGGVFSQHQERVAYACTRLHVSSRLVAGTGGVIHSDCA